MMIRPSSLIKFIVLSATTIFLFSCGSNEEIKPPPQLDISTIPENATIKIDGIEVGDSPLTKVVASGTHVIQAEANGYTRNWEKVTAVEGQTTTVEVILLSTKTPVHIVTEPAGASLTIDERTHNMHKLRYQSCQTNPTSVHRRRRPRLPGGQRR